MIKKLIKNLRKDKDEGSLYYAWQSNIAMPIVDRIQQENIVMYCPEFCPEFCFLHK